MLSPEQLEFAEYCTQIVSDREVTQDEVYQLIAWWKATPSVQNDWPGRLFAPVVASLEHDVYLDSNKMQAAADVLNSIATHFEPVLLQPLFHHKLTELRLERQSKLLDLQIAVANKRKALTEVLRRYPTLDHLTEKDRRRKHRIAALLQTQIREEAKKVGIHIKEQKELESFVEDYADDAWCKALSHIRIDETSSRLPASAVDIALRDFLMHENEILQSQAEALELHKHDKIYFPMFIRRFCKRRLYFIYSILNGPFSSRGSKRFPHYWNRFMPASLSWKQLGKEVVVTRKHNSILRSRWAGELRAVKKQHVIQKKISWWQPYLTLFAAIFMMGMLFVGMAQLVFAILEGAGMIHVQSLNAPTQAQAAHETVNTNGPQPGSEGGSLRETHPAPVQNATTSDSPSDAKGSALTHVPGRMEQMAARFDEGGHNAMQRSLQALELILVAPLPYLLILGLTRYIRALAFQEDADRYRKELMEFKGFEVSLFIAIIAAAVVGRVLSTDRELNWNFAGSAALLIAVLSAYFLIVEMQGEHAEKIAVERQKERQHEKEKEEVQKLPREE